MAPSRSKKRSVSKIETSKVSEEQVNREKKRIKRSTDRKELQASSSLSEQEEDQEEETPKANKNPPSVSRAKKTVSNKRSGKKDLKKDKEEIDGDVRGDDDRIANNNGRSGGDKKNEKRSVRRKSYKEVDEESEFSEPEEGEEGENDDDKGYGIDSDHIDSDSIEGDENEESIRSRFFTSGSNKNKTRNGSSGKKTQERQSTSNNKNGRKNKRIGSKDEDEDVEPGIISRSTMNFLKQLSIPEKNDREWLIMNEKLHKSSMKNWKEFIEFILPRFKEIDWTLPKLPSKDLIYRLNRDIRFSNDKTPYKQYFSAGFSRTGKKGPWAFYYLEIRPGNKSVIGGGLWCPEKNQLATIRNSIIRNSKPLRKVIGSVEFVEMFGKPQEGKGKTKRQNIFGHDDSLKNCPKINGIDKNHPDIDLLKLKSIAASRNFSDELVLSSSFIEEIQKSVKVLCPLVQCLNEMILPQSDDEAED